VKIQAARSRRKMQIHQVGMDAGIKNMLKKISKRGKKKRTRGEKDKEGDTVDRVFAPKGKEKE